MGRKIGAVFIGILILGMIPGCKKEPQYEEPISTSTPVPFASLKPVDDEEFEVVPSETTELPIYTLNSDLTELTAVTALVVAEKVITEEIVTEAVIDALGDNAIYVKVNKVSRKNDVITVDFSGDSPPVSQVGAGIEGLILDAFGQSLLDNVFGCNAVSFSVDGGDYFSGHFEFSKDEIYMRR